MHRSRRTLALAVAVGAMAGTAAVALSARTAASQSDPGSRALEYLQSQQSASSGAVPGSFGSNELYAIGAAAAGYDPNLLSNGGGPSVMAYLSSNAATACLVAGSTNAAAGPCGELIQAVVAAGKSPSSFGGVDLVSRLSGYLGATTPGAYGDGEAFTQALAIQGLVAAGQPVPSAALSFLHQAQDSDGGWDFLDVKDDPNAATNFDSSDTNSTAMVLMALDAAGDHSSDATALSWLHTLQNSGGGFSYQGGGSDPDSTALVVQAILATGEDPNGAAWTVAGHTPLQELVASQALSGGYAFPGNPAPDVFTTSQVPPALDRIAYPAPFATHTFYTPGTPLGGSPPAGTPPPPTPTGPPAGVVTPLAHIQAAAAAVPAANSNHRGLTTLRSSRSAPAGVPAAGPPQSMAPTQAPPSGAGRPPMASLPHARANLGTLPGWLIYTLTGAGAALLVAGGRALITVRRR